MPDPADLKGKGVKGLAILLKYLIEVKMLEEE
jgi:hypothetical protein